MVRATSRAISAWVTPPTRFALAALPLWWAWPIMRTATGSRHGAAPQRWSSGDPLPPAVGGFGALGLSMGASTTAGSTTGLSTINAHLRALGTTALDPPSPPRPAVTQIFAAKDPGQPSIARCPLAAGVEDRPADATDKSQRCFWGFPDQRAWTADSAVKRAITLTSLRAKTASVVDATDVPATMFGSITIPTTIATFVGAATAEW